MEEPFAGLFTQGMVTHESYRADDGRWLHPSEVSRADDGVVLETATGRVVTVSGTDKMSKSKRNTIDPQEIIARYGADTTRWFVLSDNPPERDMEWTETGIAGASRFVHRVNRLANAVLDAADAGQPGPARGELARTAHRTIVSVTSALDQFAFNVAVARLYELLNAISEAHRSGRTAAHRDDVRHALDIFTRLVAPMMPHLAADIMSRLRPATEGLPDLGWPEADPALLVETTMQIAVQVGGKLRGTVVVSTDADREGVLAAAMAEENVARALAGRGILKHVYVPGRIVNFVLAESS